MQKKIIVILSTRLKQFNEYNLATKIQSMLGLLLSYYFITPYFSFHNQLIFFSFCLIWILLTIKVNFVLFKKIVFNKIFIFICIFPVFMIICYLLNYTSLNKHILLIPMIYIFAKFYSDNNYREILNIYLIFIYIYFILIALVTLYQLKDNPDLARFLAQGNKNAIKNYVSPFTANYSSVYSIMFIGIITYYYALFISKIKTKSFLCFLLTSFFLFFLFKSAYTISLIIYILSIFVLSVYKVYSIMLNKKKFIIFGSLSIIFLIIIYLLFKNNIADLILSLTNKTNDIIQQRRIREVSELIRNMGFQSEGGLTNRIKLYSMSLDTFFSHPIFGVGFNDDFLYTTEGVLHPLIGNHSTILDKLASFGFFGLFYISIVPICFYEKKNKIIKNKFCFYFLLFVFIIFSTINTTENVVFYFLIIFYIPCLFITLEEDN